MDPFRQIMSSFGYGLPDRASGRNRPVGPLTSAGQLPPQPQTAAQPWQIRREDVPPWRAGGTPREVAYLEHASGYGNWPGQAGGLPIHAPQGPSRTFTPGDVAWTPADMGDFRYAPGDKRAFIGAGTGFRPIYGGLGPFTPEGLGSGDPEAARRAAMQALDYYGVLGRDNLQGQYPPPIDPDLYSSDWISNTQSDAIHNSQEAGYRAAMDYGLAQGEVLPVRDHRVVDAAMAALFPYNAYTPPDYGEIMRYDDETLRGHGFDGLREARDARYAALTAEGGPGGDHLRRYGANEHVWRNVVNSDAFRALPEEAKRQVQTSLARSYPLTTSNRILDRQARRESQVTSGGYR